MIAYWGQERVDGPYGPYLENNRGWTTDTELSPLPRSSPTDELSPLGWKKRSRQVQADDVLPGLDPAEVAELIGQPLHGIGYRGEYTVPPIFRVLHQVDTDHAVVITHGTSHSPGGLEFLTISTGARDPLSLDGEPLLDWEQIVTYGLGDEPSGADESRRVWLLAPSPDDADRMHLAVTGPFGKVFHAHRGLRRPGAERPGLLTFAGKVYVATRDESGQEVCLVLSSSGEPQDLVLPPVESFHRVPTGSTWWDDEDSPITPPSEQELAIAIGELEMALPVGATAFDDMRLYLPLGSDGLPVPLPGEAIGMLRLVQYSEQEPSAVYTNMGQIVGRTTRYPEAHSGWALVTMGNQGVELLPGGGSAQQVLYAAAKGSLPRFRTLWPVTGHRLTYAHRQEDERGIERVYRAILPPRAVGELVDGSFQAIDLNLGCVQAMAFGEPTRSDLDGLLLGLANTDAFVFNTVSGRAMSDLEVFEERQAQLERQQAASEAEARSHQLALQRAFEEARSAEWSARRGEFYELIDANTWGAPVREFLDELEFSHYSFERDYYDKYGIHSWDELRWAQNAGLDNATTRAAAEKLLGRDLAQRARDASITDEPVGFSWDAVFDTWHINNRNRKTKTEVFETRHGVRIVTYD